LKSFQPEVVHVHGRSAALRCVLAGRSADWFTLHNTHLTHQVAFYDAGLIRKYLSPWGKNFFVLNQLGGEYLQREFGVRPESIVQIRNGIDCQRFRAPAADERVNARDDLASPDETFVVFVGRFIQATSRSCRRSGRAAGPELTSNSLDQMNCATP
jgi:glycosyltransferase involved in cell wall biosynthesis